MSRASRVWAWVIGVVVLAIVLPIAWNNGIGEQILPKRWVEVAPGFFRSAQLHPRLIERVLADNGVRVIVDLTYLDPSMTAQRAEEDASRNLGIIHHRFPLDGDGDGDIRHYAGAIEVIAKARIEGAPVLVHCGAGARRAAGVVASYQVLVEGKSAEEVYPELDRYGRLPVAESPLLGYLNGNMATLASLLVERGVIERVPEPLPKFVPPG